MNGPRILAPAGAAAAASVEASPDPRRAAAALRYGGGEAGHAPRVTAKGRGLVADEIIERARHAGVPVHESRELVSLLMQVDLDAHIPPALYVAVAEVLAWVYRLQAARETSPTAPSALS